MRDWLRQDLDSWDSARCDLGGRDSRRQDLRCRDPTGQGLGDSGTQQGRFRDRQPMKQMGIAAPFSKDKVWVLWSGFGCSSPLGPEDSGDCGKGAWTQEQHHTGMS